MRAPKIEPANRERNFPKNCLREAFKCWFYVNDWNSFILWQL